MTISDTFYRQILDLQAQAEADGDQDLAAVCQRALEGDRAAREECEALIQGGGNG